MVLTKKNLIFLSLSAVFFVGTLLLFLQIVSNLREQRKFIDSEVARISKIYLTQPALEKILRDIKIKEQEIDKIYKTAFVGADNELEFVKFLENLAGEKIDQKIKFDSSKKIKKDNYYQIPLEIVLQSSFSNIIKYIYDLEKSDYYFGISSIKFFSQASEIEEEPKINAIVSGYIYSL